jgi:aminoglycoside 3-N-acetyltransferase
MSEQMAINSVPFPNTRDSLANDLRRLGLEKGMTLIVHSSLSSLGWVSGGPVAVVQALMDVVTSSGTIVMPTHTGDYSEPSYWQYPPVPEEWWPIIRDSMPAYDPMVTPTRGMGKIVEVFRSWPGVKRSSHPQVSFAAWGAYADQIVENHSLDYGMGENSPLRKMYDLDSWVLLLGVGYDNNTSFHLAEYRIPDVKETTNGAPVMENGERVWKTFIDIELDSDPFPEIGRDFEKERNVLIGRIGTAEARLFKQREAVDFAVRWLSERKQINMT